jgi:rubredoxin
MKQHWMCTNCGYQQRSDAPPADCPSCKQTCAFNDVTCYRPDCGGEVNADPILVQATWNIIQQGRR